MAAAAAVVMFPLTLDDRSPNFRAVLLLIKPMTINHNQHVNLTGRRLRGLVETCSSYSRTSKLPCFLTQSPVPARLPLIDGSAENPGPIDYVPRSTFLLILQKTRSPRPLLVEEQQSAAWSCQKKRGRLKLLSCSPLDLGKKNTNGGQQES